MFLSTNGVGWDLNGIWKNSLELEFNIPILRIKLPLRRIVIKFKMKRYYLFFTFLVSALIFGHQQSLGQTYTGDILFKTQAEVDAFGAMNYEHVTGNIFIGDTIENQTSDITSITALSTLTTFDEKLQVNYNDLLSTLNGLENLILKDKKVLIFVNESLQSLQGLNTNTDSVYSVTVSGCNALTDLSGLEHLSYVQNIYISSNASLTSLNGLQGINELLNLNLYGNESLESLSDISNLTDILMLYIIENNALSSLDGLENAITYAEEFSGNYVRIVNNSSLYDLCAITNYIDSTYNDLVSYNVFGNGYNPSVQDLLNDDCSFDIGIDENQMETTMSVFPNPTLGQVHIDFGDVKPTRMHVFNYLGQTVYEKTSGFNGALDINLDVPAGVYIVEVSSVETKNQFKVLKQ